MNVWIVNPFDPVPGEGFRPGRYATLAEMLVERGHEVTWFTSSFFHASKSFRPSEYLSKTQNRNLKVVFIETPPYFTNISARRIINHLAYAGNFRSLAGSQNERPDLILASTPPLSSAMACIKIAERLGAKCIVDVQDLWPEVYKTIFSDKFAFIYYILFFPFKIYANKIYNRAHGLVSVSKDHLNRALSVSESREKPGAVIHLGIDLQFFRETEKKYKEADSLLPQKADGELWVTYSGTIGATYDIETIIKAANILRNCAETKIFFTGTGPQLKEMKKLASQLKLENVNFLGFLPFEAMVALLKKSDVGLNALAAGSPQTASNKVNDYMAASLAIINSYKGELEELILNKKIGIQYSAGDENSLAEAILTLNQDRALCAEMGARARELVEREFDRRKTYIKFVNFLENVASGNTT